MRRIAGLFGLGFAAACAASLGAGTSALAAQGGGAVEQEARQGEVGEMSRAQAEGFAALAEEMEINFGREKAQSAAHAESVLADIADRDVPLALDAMRRMETAPAGERRDRAQAVVRTQDAILGKFHVIMDSSVTGIASDTLAQQAQAIIESQKDTEARSKAVGAKTIGMSAEALSAENRTEIDGLSARQEGLITDAASLQQSASAAAGGPAPDAATSRSARRALEGGDLDKARAAMEQAARAIKENRLGQATVLQEEAISRLAAFKRSLEGAVGAPAPDAELERVAANQRSLADETGRLPSGDAASIAARQDRLREDASRLSDALDSYPVASSYVAAAAQEMAGAARALTDSAGKPEAEVQAQAAAATAGQKKAQQYLQAARGAMSDRQLDEAFKNLQNQADQTADSADQIAALDDIANAERDLKARTDVAADAKQLSDLAPRQEEIRKRAESLRRAAQPPKAKPPAGNEDPQGEGRQGSSPAGDMDSAIGAMSQAARALRGGQTGQAKAGEQQALNSLGAARGKRAAQLSQDAEQLSQAARNAAQAASGRQLPPGMESLMRQADRMSAGAKRALQAGSLAGDERKLAAGTKALSLGMTARTQGAASQQETISGQAQALAAGAKEGDPFAQSIAGAQKEMSAATSSLRGGDAAAAASRQSEAARLLSRAAWQALTSTRQARARSSSGGGGASRTYAGTPGLAGTGPGGATWISTLPPNTPPDVLQAAGSAFPRGYEEALRRYYLDVAGRETKK